ncbi:MAG: tyrosine-type recombinase/integrase [Flavobacterium sp.]|uniref:tyrosine-type recombinase/integrase n=1 Tax=Flavobacterium sp. Leaf359 TaxID=1736351 RepID=UPI0006F833EC|nr:tyrosine-type recombinase/integrase [Flavobacterium sp. Leaf359]KQS47230.1 integrase [Flavobacterium sp. Leaf359]MBU7571590.1 tyrosine-type recombinase/integrase [Flavobacterium sp.]PZO29516.1 MAG: integrase [Flavobacteriaceae bacterium]PZQ91283.1 MAG: integrase [Flavobacterium johnsoniae]
MLDNKESFKDYLQKEKKYSLHTVTAYSNDLSDFEAFLKQDFDQDSLEDVNYSQIRSWIVSLVDAGISNTSVNRKISSLKSFYKFLLKIKRIQVSPLLKHKALKTPKKLQIPFSEKELDNVLNYIVYPEGFEGMRDKLVIDLFYTTGIRRAELIGLKVANVDLSKGVLKVLGKRNKERILPMLPVIQEQIRLYLSERAGLEEIKDGEFFFLTLKGVKLNDSLVYRLINMYFSNVSEKVKKSPHVLRHTFATHMLNNGADLNSVKELLGHSSLASTQIYTHSSLAELKKVYGDAHPRNQK